MSDKGLVGYGAIEEDLDNENIDIVDEDDLYGEKEKRPKKDIDDDYDPAAARPPSRSLTSDRPPLKAAPSLVSASYGREEGSDESDSSDEGEDVDLSLLYQNKAGLLSSQAGKDIESIGSGGTSPASVDTNDDTADDIQDLKKDVLNSLDDVKLPPEPEGRCSRSLQDKIIKMLEKKHRGKLSLNEHVQKKKDFRNPSIYEKLVLYCGIDETGTNYPRHLYNPSSWGPESYYDALAKAQKEAHEKKEKEKHKRAHVEFVTATKKATGTLISSQPTSDDNKKKSKWDSTKLPDSSKISNPNDLHAKKPKLS